MAWRETRAALGKFLFVVLAVALGVAALTAVTGFNQSVSYTLFARGSIARWPRTISLRMPVEPSAEETRFSNRSRPKASNRRESPRPFPWPRLAGGAHSGFGQGRGSRAISLLRPPRVRSPAGAKLDSSSVAVSDDLLLRSNIHLGDSIKIGNGKYPDCGAHCQENRTA